jgi:hypothetical protein
VIIGQTDWTLEIAKLAVELVVGLLTPVAILVLGIWATGLAEHFKAGIWANQKVIEKRIAVYDELAPLLNDLYCYYSFVGHWKELAPPRILEIKRELDKKVYINASLFSRDFRPFYNTFIHLCFQTFVGANLDAKLRTLKVSKDGNREEAFPGTWDVNWDKKFSDEAECYTKAQIKDAYNKLMDRFSSELGIGLK